MSIWRRNARPSITMCKRARRLGSVLCTIIRSSPCKSWAPKRKNTTNRGTAIPSQYKKHYSNPTISKYGIRRSNSNPTNKQFKPRISCRRLSWVRRVSSTLNSIQYWMPRHSRSCRRISIWYSRFWRREGIRGRCRRSRRLIIERGSRRSRRGSGIWPFLLRSPTTRPIRRRPPSSFSSTTDLRRLPPIK